MFTAIDADLPRRACPGDVITIVGENFGTTAGLVRFKCLGESEFIDVAPVSGGWSDTEIRVTVPDGAGCGVTLRIPEGTERLCGHPVTVYRRGVIDVDFAGTAPEILSFYVTRPGVEDQVYLLPGERVTVRWEVCAATEIRVELVDLKGRVLVERDPAPASGTLRPMPPGHGDAVRWQARISATGWCDPPAERTIDVSVLNPPFRPSTGSR